VAHPVRTHLLLDVRGYGRIVETSGDAGAAQLMRAYERIVRSKLPRATLHAVRVADSFHVVFSTPIEAVRTAIEIADAFQHHNARHVEMTIPVGFGIDAGPTIRQREHYVGAAPVLAARLAARARAGQVLVSDGVVALLRNAKLPHLGDLGAWKAPDGQSTRVYEVRASDSPAAMASSGRFLSALFFTDIVESTPRAVEIGDRRWRDVVEHHHSIVREELERHRGSEIDTAGDGFYASFDAPSRAIDCALAVRDRLHALGVDIRAGVHVGECEMVAGKIGGLAVVVGSRVKDRAGAGEILVSQTVKDVLIGTRFAFVDRGRATLKGVPDELGLWAVEHEAATP
jgi:class 3 adenylate cyclase